MLRSKRPPRSSSNFSRIWLGDTDCCQFVRSYLKRRTGSDPGTLDYVSKRQALALIAQHGGIEGLLSSFLGEPIDDPQRGDVVLCGEVPGIHGGYCVWAFQVPPDPAMSGVSRINVETITRGWKCLV